MVFERVAFEGLTVSGCLPSRPFWARALASGCFAACVFACFCGILPIGVMLSPMFRASGAVALLWDKLSRNSATGGGGVPVAGVLAGAVSAIKFYLQSDVMA